MLHRRDIHVPFRWLVDLRDGTLSGARAQEAREHLGRGCVRCTARAARIERVIAAVAAGALERPPAAVLRRALDAVRAACPPDARPAPGVVLGRLLIDQRASYAATLRDSPGDTRRLLYLVGEHEVDAAVVVRGGRSDLLGQFLAAGDDPDRAVEGHVVLRATSGREHRTELLPDGRFTLRGIRGGTYVLAGRVAGLAFELPALRLGG